MPATSRNIASRRNLSCFNPPKPLRGGGWNGLRPIPTAFGRCEALCASVVGFAHGRSHPLAWVGATRPKGLSPHKALRAVDAPPPHRATPLLRTHPFCCYIDGGERANTSVGTFVGCHLLIPQVQPFFWLRSPFTNPAWRFSPLWAAMTSAAAPRHAHTPIAHLAVFCYIRNRERECSFGGRRLVHPVAAVFILCPRGQLASIIRRFAPSVACHQMCRHAQSAPRLCRPCPCAPTNPALIGPHCRCIGVRYS